MVALVLLVLLVLASAGCGGGAESTLTKAEFIKRADSICDKADKRQESTLNAFYKAHPEVNSSKAWQEKIVLAAALPPVRFEAEELAALPAPSGSEEKAKAIVDGMEEAVEKGEADPSALLKKGSSGPFSGVVGLARKYGFKACVNPL